MVAAHKGVKVFGKGCDHDEEVVEYYHLGVVCHLIEHRLAVPLDVELLRPGEGEEMAAGMVRPLPVNPSPPAVHEVPSRTPSCPIRFDRHLAKACKSSRGIQRYTTCGIADDSHPFLNEGKPFAKIR
jgi:hypothetical protein